MLIRTEITYSEALSITFDAYFMTQSQWEQKELITISVVFRSRLGVGHFAF